MFPILILFLLTASVFGNAINNGDYKDTTEEAFRNSNRIVTEGDRQDSGEDVDDEVLRTLFEELDSDPERRWAYPRMATVLMVPAGPNWTVYGSLKVYEFKRTGLLVKGKLFNLTPGLHAFHVHANGSTGLNCTSTGPHFNPDNVTHGGPQTPIHHAGDLGNIFASSNGIAKIKILTNQMTLNPASPYYIMGRSFDVHAAEDDVGLGNNTLSLINGNSGMRQACGIIVPRYK